jgi:cellulose synthase/poly-beta-1,6-N-acetylglucosamine synthase-like glycosyltransferase
MSWLAALTWIELSVLCPLAVLGLHRGWMLALYSRGRRSVCPNPPVDRDALPRVTVQLPLFNERYVATRLIEAVAALDYPRDRLHIQVLDDSTDDTPEVVAACIARLPRDLATSHVRRADRSGFKAGALAAGLAATDSPLVAVFDADFVPPRDFLLRTVPLFTHPEVGMVQCRWEHRNACDSLLTRMQGLLLDGHFAVEHVARAGTGCFFNFNGTAGVFRRACIVDAGGWQGDTLTEDMDLSYRAQLRGWRFLYRPDIACPADLSDCVNAFVNQQHRWAKGSIQTARKLLPAILRARLPLRVKVESSFHLLGNFAFPLLALLIVVALPLHLLRATLGAAPPTWLGWLEGAPLLLATCSVLLYYGVAQLELRRARLRTLCEIPLVLAVGAGLCVSNTVAVISGLFGPTGAFLRTPKHDARIAPRRSDAASYRAHRGGIAHAEIAFGAWATGTAAAALWVGLPVTAALHALFGSGLLWFGITSSREDRRTRAMLAVSPAP